MGKLNNLQNKKFGRLVAKEIHSRSRNGHIRWTCVCECGVTKDILATHLISGKTKSCGCARAWGKNHKMWTGYGEISGQMWGNILRGARGEKGRAPIELTITIEEAWSLFLKQERKCALSGIVLTTSIRYNQPGTASLDRIDSGEGYHLSNVQWVHKDINKMKSNLAQDRFIELCKAVSLISGTCEI